MSTKAAAQSPQDPIPAGYRIFFTWLDPIIAIWGAYLGWFDPETTLSAYIPPSLSTYNPDHYMLFRIMAADLLMVGFLSIVLLRNTADVRIWKIFEGSILIVDLVMLVTIWEALGKQGRRSLSGVRPEDWACIAITGGVAVIRSLFLAGVGLAPQGRSVKQS